MDRKKIIILVNSLANGGGEKAAADLANSLSEHNMPVDIILLEDKIRYKVNDGIGLKLVPLSKTLSRTKLSFLLNVTCFFYLIFQLRINRECVVISHLYRANYINAVAKYIIKHNAILVTHGSIEKYTIKNNLKSKINLILIGRLFSNASCRVFLTERMKKAFEDYIPWNNNYIIQNCIDVNNIIGKSKESFDKADSKLPEEYFIFVGRLNPVKNVKQLIEVFKKKEHENLIIVGDGPEEKLLKKLASDSNNIFFLGSKNNPYKYIKRAKALVLISISEGFPNVLLESLALKTPIITTDCKTGPREILNMDDVELSDYSHNEIGVMFEYISSSALEAVIENFDEFIFDEHAMFNKACEYSGSVISQRYLSLVNKY